MDNVTINSCYPELDNLIKKVNDECSPVLLSSDVGDKAVLLGEKNYQQLLEFIAHVSNKQNVKSDVDLALESLQKKRSHN